MDCTKCKKQIPDDSQFCSYCGNKFVSKQSGDGTLKGAAMGAGAALGGVLLGSLFTAQPAMAATEVANNLGTNLGNANLDTHLEGSVDSVPISDSVPLDYGMDGTEADVLSAFDTITQGDSSSLVSDVVDVAASDTGVIDALGDIFS